MYLAVMIDSEHYDDFGAYLCKSIQDGFNIFRNIFVSEHKAKYEANDNRIVATYVGDFGGEDFSVCEVYEIDEKLYRLIWWHAYDGVDFTVRTFDTFEEAKEVMLAEANELMSMIEDAKQRSDCEDGICIDTGIEWENWRIV